MILETYAPESCVNHQSSAKIYLQPPSRSWTRRCGHMRSCHPRWSGHRRRRPIVVSLWGKRWKSISWDRHVAITRHRRHRSPRWWGHTLWWHWLSRIRWSTSTLGCYSCPPRCHLLISLCFCPLKFLLCFRMLIFHPFGFDRNWIWWALCRPLFLHQFLPNSSQPW